MYAVIETGGKQYRVEANDTIYVEKLEANEGEEVTLDKVIVSPTPSSLSRLLKAENHDPRRILL